MYLKVIDRIEIDNEEKNLIDLEYCSRYGVRGCVRHLYYLNDLLDRAEQGFMIDPQLIHYSYVFCASHVSGNR